MASQVISSISTQSAAPEARPAPSLRAALDALAKTAQNGMQLAIAVVHLQRDLIAAETARLIGVGASASIGIDPAGAVDAIENNLAARALNAATTVAEHIPNGVMIATPIGISMRDDAGNPVHLVGLFALTKATPLAMAMAQERLELSAALARALIAQKSAQPAAASTTAAALDFANARTASEGLGQAAKALAQDFSVSRVVVASMAKFRVADIADSADAKLSPEYRQRIKLAACEVVDLGGTLSCGGPGDPPALPGIAKAFPGLTVYAKAALTADGDGVVALLMAPAQTQGLASHLEALAAAIVARAKPSLIATRVDTLLAKLPVLARLAPDQRWPVAKRALIGGAVLLCLLPVPRTVSATVSIEPLTRRIVSAPIVGRIDHVRVQPGDTVVAGKTVLVELDTQALQAERDQAMAAMQSAMAQATTARAEGDPDNERSAQLRAEQAQAQIALLDYRITEAAIVAPISGVVMGEDMRRREGAQVSRGESLFEIAAPGRYRAEVLVPDRDIDRVTPGAPLSMHLSAYSFGRFSGTVERVYPLAELEHGNNVFRVIAQIDATEHGLQPGMAGSARIRSGWQPLGWTVLQPVVDVIRKALWI